jgi:hypothetical protein
MVAAHANLVNTSVIAFIVWSRTIMPVNPFVQANCNVVRPDCRANWQIRFRMQFIFSR